MDNDTNMGEVPASRLLDPQIFEHLKNKIDEDQQVRDQMSQTVQKLDRAISYVQGLLSRIHATPREQYVQTGIQKEIEVIGELQEIASKHPYYKYNQKWNRQVQNAIFTVLLCGWLGGLTPDGKPGPVARLLTLEEVGEIFKAEATAVVCLSWEPRANDAAVPVNLKDRDAFHLTIEEYLLALTDLTQELSRLATNAVTLSDFAMPVEISSFVKDLFAGFQLLNLKNDILRKRVDAVKYDVKRVEDVVYDLSLRNLIPEKQKDAAVAESTSAPKA
ncbi:translin-associated protein X [Colletotrichum spaethianum]|uniref:Translin-associated protein X n=1 Tax=Colletotrichum spaethianum TaxID=700344 RepID=A0AA37P1J8_9PEZI|nr:translin-associated protein X [Colletotrichum spaethianum]GKT44963.1 translin-associated protein X [Colletotrichum spaethianum]